MKLVRTGAAAILVGLMSACATQMPTGDKAEASSGAASMGVSPPGVTEIHVTNDAKYRWGEHQIAVDPKNPKHLVYVTVGIGFTNDCQAHGSDCQMVQANLGVGGMLFPQAKGIFANPDFTIVVAYTTFDGGRTWKHARVPATPVDHPDLTGQGDPSVAVTPDGTFYVSFDANNWGTPEKGLPDAGVGVSKSTDGGLTWSKPVLTGTPVDGPKLVADSVTGTLYANSSTVLGPHSTGDAKSPVGKLSDRWVVSTKDGLHWTKPQPMGGTGMVGTAANGVFATVFKTAGQPSMFGGANNEQCGRAPAPCTIFETTTDSGATWSRHIMSVPNAGGPMDQPLVAADPSKKGHFAVAIAVNDGKAFDIYQTFDSGNTWSKPTTVTDDASKKHYHAAMAYSHQGVLGIMSRTMQPKAGQNAEAPAGGPFAGPSFPYNVWAAISRDGGATFSKPLRVSAADSPAPQSGPFANGGDDYSSIAIGGDTVYVGWADWRTPERGGFMAVAKFDAFK